VEAIAKAYHYRRTPPARATRCSCSSSTTWTPLVAGIAARGIEPANRETYSNGVRKITFRDADGNEVGFGGMPAE